MALPTTMDTPARRDANDGASRSPAASAGALLRAAREQQGMHIATLAAAIKVAPRKLEALENDRWDELPGPTFTRALAQAVCRALKSDPQPVMELLPAADTSMLDSTFGTINEPFSGRGVRDIGWPAWVPRGPWLIAALLLLLAAAVVIWMPPGTWSKWFGAARAGNGEATAAINLPPLGAGPLTPSAPKVSPTVAAPAPESGAAQAGAALPLGTPSLPSAPTAATVEPTAAAMPGAAAAVQAAVPAGALVVASRARSWVEVTDGRGRVLMSRNLEAGESIGLDGWAPLQVVVGNAEATTVTYKGAVVDLVPRTRDNVARVDLK